MKWIFMILGVSAIALVVVFMRFSSNSNSEKEQEVFVPNEKTRENVETYWEIMRAAVYDSVTTDKADDYQEDMDWFANFVKERSVRFGELQSIDAPTYSGPDDATIVVRFEKNAYAFDLAIDNNEEIAQINMANYAPDETLTKLTWEELGDDTLRTTIIDDFASFREAFARDKGKVRLISILSPT